jgi:hypothetical protein
VGTRPSTQVPIVAAARDSDSQASALYQWLPTEFMVDGAGKATIHSYLNNLHPTAHADLYATIARVFECGLPLLEHTLSYAQLANPMWRSTPIPSARAWQSPTRCSALRTTR